MLKTTLKIAALAAIGVCAMAASASASAGELLIESWRNDDTAIWKDKIIPAFEKSHPDIKLSFTATPPAAYDALLRAKLEGGTAGDIISCKPYDVALDLFNRGYLSSVNDVPSLKNFSDMAKAAWSTDDGKTTFCMPMGAVIHGFIYNKDIFQELGLSVPKTEDEFYAVLDKIKADGKYVPLVLGTKDQWESSCMGFENIGPNYWHGEDGRKALIAGTQKFTDPVYVKTFQALAKWSPYLGDGYKAQSYPDSQNLFGLGKGAIYAAGSWDISLFRAQGVNMGAFPPPLPAGEKQLYISDHIDIGIGMNGHAKNPADAKVFLDWTGSEEFANIFANALPGFYPLSNFKVEVKDDVAQTFVSWRDNGKSTIRNAYQFLSRGTPNMNNELWTVSANVINSTQTPDDAAKQIQDGLAKWYPPQQK